MALTIDGIPVSGSKGASTFSRNRYGAYQRRRTKPVNPDSVLQQSIRSNMRTAVELWTDTLTEVQRQAWTDWAAAVPWLNKIGETVQLTGQAAWIRAYVARNYWLLTPTGYFAPPPSATLPSLVITEESVQLTYDISANTLEFEAGAPLASNSWQVETGRLNIMVSQPVNLSRNFRPNRFRKLGTYVVGEVPTATVNLAGETSPWVPWSGCRMWVKLRAIDADFNVSVEQLVGPAVVTVQA